MCSSSVEFCHTLKPGERSYFQPCCKLCFLANSLLCGLYFGSRTFYPCVLGGVAARERGSALSTAPCGHLCSTRQARASTPPETYQSAICYCICSVERLTAALHIPYNDSSLRVLLPALWGLRTSGVYHESQVRLGRGCSPALMGTLPFQLKSLVWTCMERS